MAVPFALAACSSGSNATCCSADMRPGGLPEPVRGVDAWAEDSVSLEIIPSVEGDDDKLESGQPPVDCLPSAGPVACLASAGPVASLASAGTVAVQETTGSAPVAARATSSSAVPRPSRCLLPSLFFSNGSAEPIPHYSGKDVFPHHMGSCRSLRRRYLAAVGSRSLGGWRKARAAWECSCRVLLLVAAVAGIMVAQCGFCLAPPAYVPGSGWRALLLPPLPYYVLLAVGVANLASFQMGYEEFAEGATWRGGAVLALRIVCYYGGAILLRRGSTVLGNPLASLCLDCGWSAGSLGLDILVVASATVWHRTHSVRTVVAALLGLAPTAVYIVGVHVMLLANVFVFSGSRYLSLIVMLEKVVLRLFRSFVLRTAPCGYPKWLLCAAMHFEIDLQIIASLALASVRSPLLAAQHMAFDWATFALKCKAIYFWDTDLTPSKVEEAPLIRRWQMKVTLNMGGTTALFPGHLYLAKVINDMLEGVAQSATYLCALVFLSVATARGDSAFELEFRHYFLPGEGLQGLCYVGLMLASSLLQDVLLQVLIAKRGMSLQSFVRDLTSDWRHLLYYATKGGASSIWVFLAASSLAWYHTVDCRESGGRFCPVGQQLG